MSFPQEKRAFKTLEDPSVHGMDHGGYCTVLPRTLYRAKGLNSSAVGSAAGRKPSSVISAPVIALAEKPIPPKVMFAF